jgi:hypothetical protein
LNGQKFAANKLSDAGEIDRWLLIGHADTTTTNVNETKIDDKLFNQRETREILSKRF